MLLLRSGFRKNALVPFSDTFDMYPRKVFLRSEKRLHGYMFRCTIISMKNVSFSVGTRTCMTKKESKPDHEIIQTQRQTI